MSNHRIQLIVVCCISAFIVIAGPQLGNHGFSWLATPTNRLLLIFCLLIVWLMLGISQLPPQMTTQSQATAKKLQRTLIKLFFIRFVSIFKPGKSNTSQWHCVLVMGPQKSGKSTLIKNLSQNAKANTDYAHHDSQESLMWWQIDNTQLIEITICDDPRQQNSLSQIFAILKWHQFWLPISNMMVVLDLNWLYRKNHHDQLAVIGQVNHSVRLIGNNIKDHQIVFNKADRIQGFKQFFSGISTEQRSYPLSIEFTKNPYQSIDDALTIFTEKLTNHGMHLVSHQFSSQERQQILEFPRQIDALRNSMSSLIKKTYANTAQSLSGIYFCSSQQQGAAIDYLHDAIDRSVGARLPTINPFPETNVYFTQGIHKATQQIVNRQSILRKINRRHLFWIVLSSGFLNTALYTYQHFRIDITHESSSEMSTENTKDHHELSNLTSNTLFSLLKKNENRIAGSDNLTETLAQAHMTEAALTYAQQLSQSKNAEKSIFPNNETINLSLRKLITWGKRHTNLGDEKLKQISTILRVSLERQAIRYWKEQLNAASSQINSISSAIHILSELAAPNSPTHQIIQHLYHSKGPLRKINAQKIALSANRILQDITDIQQSNDQQQAFFLFSKQIAASPQQENAIAMFNASAARFPEPIASPLKKIGEQIWALYLSQTQAYIRMQWQKKIIPFYRQHIENRFPLSRSENEISSEDFSAFFSPAGMMQSFYDLYLSEFTDQQSGYRHWKKIYGQSLSFSQSECDVFTRAHLITEMFFNQDGLYKTTKFSLSPNAMPAFIQSLNIIIGTQEQTYRHQSMPMSQFTWPNKSPINEVRLTDRTGHITNISYSGFWGLLRLLYSGPAQTGQSSKVVLLKPSGTPVPMQFTLTTNSPTHPFIPKVLSLFRAPNVL